MNEIVEIYSSPVTEEVFPTEERLTNIMQGLEAMGIATGATIATEGRHGPVGEQGEPGVPGDSEFPSEEELAAAVEAARTEGTSTPDGLIPVNAPISAGDPTMVRFSSAIWYEEVQKQSVTLAGCGGIGSYVGFLLGRMKPATLYLYDDDRVETANLSGQLFRQNDVGNYKVNALRQLIEATSNYGKIYTSTMRFTEASLSTPVMICGFDNMEARKVFFHRWEKSLLDKVEKVKSRALFIDGRLAAEEFQVFAFTGDNIAARRAYEKEFLFDDSEAEETTCSFKQTSYMANMIASVMVNIFTNFCANQCGLILPREIPFLTSYTADFMELKTTYL